MQVAQYFFNIMRYNYSIIIPHHNIPRLLRRCLESIPPRDDLQIIVIDDTSNQESVKKVRLLESEYKGRVEFYYSREGKGGGAARNLGISKAKGNFLMFVDADDFLLPAIETIFEKYKDTDADIVFFNAVAVDSDTGAPSERARHLRNMFEIAGKDNNKGECLLRYLFGEPWCKIVRLSVVVDNKIRFDEIPIHNDTTYSYLAGFYASKAILDPLEAYCLTERSGSVSKLVSAEKRRVRMDVFSRKNAFLKSKGIPYFDHMIFAPVVIALKALDFRELSKVLSIASTYNISVITLFKEYLKYKRSLNSRPHT